MITSSNADSEFYKTHTSHRTIMPMSLENLSFINFSETLQKYIDLWTLIKNITLIVRNLKRWNFRLFYLVRNNASFKRFCKCLYDFVTSVIKSGWLVNIKVNKTKNVFGGSKNMDTWLLDSGQFPFQFILRDENVWSILNVIKVFRNIFTFNKNFFNENYFIYFIFWIWSAIVNK